MSVHHSASEWHLHTRAILPEQSLIVTQCPLRDTQLVTKSTRTDGDQSHNAINCANQKPIWPTSISRMHEKVKKNVHIPLSKHNNTYLNMTSICAKTQILLNEFKTKNHLHSLHDHLQKGNWGRATTTTVVGLKGIQCSPVTCSGDNADTTEAKRQKASLKRWLDNSSYLVPDSRCVYVCVRVNGVTMTFTITNADCHACV